MREEPTGATMLELGSQRSDGAQEKGETGSDEAKLLRNGFGRAFDAAQGGPTLSRWLS
jgi:hypothetical protein